MFDRTRYKKELKEAQGLLSELLKERSLLDERIARLRQDIGSLAQLAGQQQGTTLMEYMLGMGLSEACLEVLRASSEPLTAADVRDKLELIGFDTSQYSNILASIHTTLRRMTDDDGEAEETEKDGKKAYRRKHSILDAIGARIKRPETERPRRRQLKMPKD